MLDHVSAVFIWIRKHVLAQVAIDNPICDSHMLHEDVIVKFFGVVGGDATEWTSYFVMTGLLVALECGEVGEAGRAVLAEEGSVDSVSHLVSAECRPLVEGPRTLRAFERSFTRMDPFVLVTSRRVSESLVTPPTRIGSLTGMTPLVDDVAIPRTERFVAPLAVEESFGVLPWAILVSHHLNYSTLSHNLHF